MLIFVFEYCADVEISANKVLVVIVFILLSYVKFVVCVVKILAFIDTHLP